MERGELMNSLKKFLKLGACICVFSLVCGSILSAPGTSYALTSQSNMNQVSEDDSNLAAVYGDLNADKLVNSMDCALMVRYILGRISEFPNKVELRSADVNGDGKIDSIDLQLIKGYVLQQIYKFPVEEKVNTPLVTPTLGKKPEDFTGTLTLAHFNNDEAIALVEAFEEAYPNVKVKLQVTADTNGAYQTLIASELRSGQGDADVFASEVAFVKRFVNFADGYEDLSAAPYNAEELKSKLAPYTIDIGRSDDGKIRALSHQACVGALGYKRDIAKKYLGTDDSEKISEMFSTSDKILETGRKLKLASGGKAKLFPGMTELMRMYLGAHNQAWVEDGKLVIDPKIEEFVDLAKKLRDEDIIGRMDAWTPQWSAAIQDDVNLAWAIPTWGIPWIIDVNQAENQKRTGDWGLAKGPSAYAWGGTWFGICKGSKNKELAWEFIKFITCNKEQSIAWAKSSGDFISNLEAIDTLSKDETMVSKTINQNPYEVYGPMIKEINGSTMTLYDDIITNDFCDAMKLYLSGKITKDQMWLQFKQYVSMDLGEQIKVY